MKPKSGFKTFLKKLHKYRIYLLMLVTMSSSQCGCMRAIELCCQKV